MSLPAATRLDWRKVKIYYMLLQVIYLADFVTTLCVRLYKQPAIISVELFVHRVPKTLLLIDSTKIQYARDGEGPHFCIKQNKNMHSELC